MDDVIEWFKREFDIKLTDEQRRYISRFVEHQQQKLQKRLLENRWSVGATDEKPRQLKDARLFSVNIIEGEPSDESWRWVHRCPGRDNLEVVFFGEIDKCGECGLERGE